MKMSTYRKWALCFLGMNLMFVPSLVFAQRNDEATEQRHELLIMDIQIQPIQNALSIKFHYDIPQ